MRFFFLSIEKKTCQASHYKNTYLFYIQFNGAKINQKRTKDVENSNRTACCLVTFLFSPTVENV